MVIALQKLDYTLTSSIMIADSKCAISAVRSTKSHLPYFQNRVAKTRENMEFVRKFCPMGDVHSTQLSFLPRPLLFSVNRTS